MTSFERLESAARRFTLIVTPANIRLPGRLVNLAPLRSHFVPNKVRVGAL